MNKNIIIILSILAICVLAQFSLMLNQDWFQFARAEIQMGQWWRFLTANFVHLSWQHLGMNALGLVLIYALFPNVLQWNAWIVVLLLTSLSVTFGIWLFNPDIVWYVGLSGALHGILVILLVLDYVTHQHRLNILLFIAVLTKLIWEMWVGPVPGSETTAGGPVVVQAHSYGFFGGILMLSFLFIYNKNKKLIE